MFYCVWAFLAFLIKPYGVRNSTDKKIEIETSNCYKCYNRSWNQIKFLLCTSHCYKHHRFRKIKMLIFVKLKFYKIEKNSTKYKQGKELEGDSQNVNNIAAKKSGEGRGGKINVMVREGLLRGSI